MKIAISSAPVVSKEAVVESMKKNHPGATLVEDPGPALCRAYGFQTIYEMPRDLQAEVRERILRDHLESLTQDADTIYAFSAIEWLADWMRWFWSETPTEKWEEIEALGRSCAQKYDEIHHVGGNTDRGYDGYAWLDRRNSTQIERLMSNLFRDLGVEDKVKE